MEPYLIDKPVGATPLEALGMLRVARPELTNIKMSYAGRLDPMASGLLVALHGPMLTHQEDFWSLSKEYEAAIVLGIQSDSYDALGLVERAHGALPNQEVLLAAVQGLVGKAWFSVPAYSSYRVNGKPLFAHAKEGTGAVAPVRRMVVSQIDVLAVEPTRLTDVRSEALCAIARVRGDFRQNEIGMRWQEHADDELLLLRLRIACSGGTYIRSLAHTLGERLGCGALLWQLRRTKVGSWGVDDSIVFRPGKDGILEG